jgi:uncharacterized protein Yka (UPF0111/DUF47 family)
MSVFSDNIGVILTAVTGAIGGIAAFFGGKKSRESNANLEIGKAYELMAKQNNAFLEVMTTKVDEQTKKIEHLEGEVNGLRTENRQLLNELKKYRQ